MVDKIVTDSKQVVTDVEQVGSDVKADAVDAVNTVKTDASNVKADIVKGTSLLGSFFSAIGDLFNKVLVALHIKSAPVVTSDSSTTTTK